MAKWPSYLHTNKKYVYTMTAVKLLIAQLKTTLPISMFEDVVIQDCFEQAKQKEKEQTERDFINGYKHGLKPLNHDVIDNYYNETYGK